MDIIDSLVEALAPILHVPVVGQTPNPRPPKWVLIERSGGIGTLSSDEPMLTFEAWSDISKKDASDLAQQARDWVTLTMPPVLPGGIRVTRRREIGGPSYQPPTASGSYRYRWTALIKHQRIRENT